MTCRDDDCPCPCHSSTPSPGWRPPEWMWATPADLRLVHDAITSLEKAFSKELRKLGKHMSALEDVLADLDTATNEVATKIDAQTAQIADLAAQLAAALPGSAQAAELQAQIDAAVTAIGSESARLHGLAADPANPVPEPAPEG